jgi:transmembrane sensor
LAAAAAILAVVGIATWRLSGTTELAPAVATTYDTRVGVGDSITLPDSSRVILAPGSRLTVAASYGQGHRDVNLQGAGQFTVRHDAGRPFTVRSGSALVRDLGTTFTIKASDGAEITVAVTEGSVLLSDSAAARQAQAVELRAGDRGRLTAHGTVVLERGTVTPDEVSWVTGMLVYRDTPLAEVRADLRRWYGVVLVVRDSAWAAQTISTGGAANEPVGKILQKLASIYGGVVTQRGDSVFIDKPGDRSKH